MTLTYYGWARNPHGALEQVRVTREGPAGHMRQTAQEFTGVTYRTERAAAADVARLNGCQ